MGWHCVRGLIVTLSLTCLCAHGADDSAAGQRVLRPEFAMYHDPEFPPVPREQQRLDPELLPLWQRALERPEAEMQRLAAHAVAESARDGFPGMEAFREDLLRIVSSTEARADARFAAADALIVLETREASDALYEAARTGEMGLRMRIEPALAEWEYAPIRDVWRARLRDLEAGRRDLQLAIAGLGAARDADAVPDLLKIVRDRRRAGDLRLAAARGTGRIAESGLEEQAQGLVAGGNAPLIDRTCGVLLLNGHRSEEAVGILTASAADDDGVVAERSLGTLLKINPELVLPLAETAMSHADPKVRRHGAEAYILLPTPERMVSVSRLLNDPHPEVRGYVCDSLYELAERAELNDAIRQSAVEVLAGDEWRGQEQAALLLGALDHEIAADRLLELLSAERSEVMVAAAWALRKLAVPATLAEMLAQAERQSEARRTGRGNKALDRQVAHLFEAFGLMNYSAAEPLLREYVPKEPLNGYYSRGAAIWSLGWLHAGAADEELAEQFVERMNDVIAFPPVPPEFDIVWRMSATSLGRMRAVSRVSALQKRLSNTDGHDPVAYAIRWSLHEITGEELPIPPPKVRGRAGWFLEPLGVSAPAAETP